MMATAREGIGGGNQQSVAASLKNQFDPPLSSSRAEIDRAGGKFALILCRIFFLVGAKPLPWPMLAKDNHVVRKYCGYNVLQQRQPGNAARLCQSCHSCHAPHAVQPDRNNKKAGIMGQGIVSFHRSWGLAVALVCVSPIAYAEVQDYVQAGIIKVVHGDVQVLRQGAVQKPAEATSPQAASPQIFAHVGDRLFSGDRVVTGDGAAVGITLRDDTLVSLGPKSTFVLEQYNFNESSGEGNVAVRVVKGTLRYVTGLIGKHAPERQQVMTPTATIGIRGTDFIVDVASE